ncbi:MAG: AraC family transcriptional regulator [Rhodobacteraceae bacterium]|nr:AraC family transcriptional regulator [Paracoccaceae bacterium]
MLGRVLSAVRLTGAVFFAVDASSPWCVDVPIARDYAAILLPEAPHILSYHIIVDGEGWAAVPGADPVRFGPGDIVVFPQGDAYRMESRPGTPPELDRGQTLDFFRALSAGALPFVIPEGGGAEPRARFICGFLGCEARPFNPILASLPRMLHLSRPGAGGGDVLDRLIDLTMEEARASRAGRSSVSLRLSELMFMELLRQYAGSPAEKPPGWLAALGDAPVARALDALHADPARDWSVADLGREAGLSRSALAARFAARLGQPPLRYLTRWRMQLAATALLDPARPLAAIAEEVGYSSETALSRSFKRETGLSPQAWRRARLETSSDRR